MRTIKFLLIFISLFIYLVLGYIIRLFLIAASPYRTLKVVNRLTYYLMHTFKKIAGFKIVVSGQADILKEEGLFIVSPHIGYLDGIVLGMLVPGSFTTKEEIKKLPLFGQVVSVGGSIFIDRTKRNNVVDYIEEMTARLKNGINIFHFPEGHATDGTKILQFFSAFFDAPLKAGSSIVPVTINYEKVNDNMDFNKDEIYCCREKISIVKHFWNLLRFRNIHVIITIHDKIVPDESLNNSKARKYISDLCLKRLSSYANLPISDEPVFKNIPSR